MAEQDRTTADALTFLAELARKPQGFDFHVALRRFEAFFRDRPRVGEATHPAEEPLRLGQEPTLAFAPSPLHSFTPSREGAPAKLSVLFFGLFGPNGPLPLHLTEYVRDRVRNAGDRTLAAFADLFHHRMLSLFHRAWTRSQPTAQRDRPEEDRFFTYVGALSGFGTDALSDRDLLPDRAKRYYAAHLANPTRNADGLRLMVEDFFEVPTQIEEFIGEWVDLPEDSRFRLGGVPETSALGRTTVVGKRIWLVQHRFRLVLGPLGRSDFHRFLPGSPSLARLSALVRTYAGDELTWDARLVLSPDATDQLELSRSGRLGWNTRLGARPSGRRGEDVIVSPLQERTRRSQKTLSP